MEWEGEGLGGEGKRKRVTCSPETHHTQNRAIAGGTKGGLISSKGIGEDRAATSETRKKKESRRLRPRNECAATGTMLIGAVRPNTVSPWKKRRTPTVGRKPHRPNDNERKTIQGAIGR